MKTDPKINVDQPTAKKIAQIICSEIKTSIAKNGKRYELAKRSQNQYNQITKWMEKGRTCDSPWLGGADYFIPLTEWIVDAIYARAMRVLFAQEPFMTASGVEAADVEKASGITDFLDMVFREIIRLQQNIGFYIKQMIILPFSVLKYDWEQEYETMIGKENAQVLVNPEGKEEYLLPDDPEAMLKTLNLMANGYQPTGQQKEVWTEEDKEIINAPKLHYIRFDDYVYSPSAKRGTRLYWEGDRFYLTLNDLKVKKKQDKFISDSVKKILESLDFGTGSETEKAIGEREELRECFNWYGRLPFSGENTIDFEDPDAIEQEVVCIIDYKAEQLLMIKHWDWERIPYPDRVYIRGEFEETEEFEGRSMAQKLFMTQKELNTFHNTIMNNAWLAMQKIFVKKRTLQGEDWQKPKVYPGAMWEEDMPGDIRVLDIGDVKAIAFELEQTFLNFAERLSNISIFQTGTARTEGGQKTLGEVQNTISEGNIGLDKFIQRCHNILRTICKWTIGYYAERMPPGLERRIRGEGAEMIFPAQENMGTYQEKGINPYWRQEDLMGNFDYIWKGTSLSASREWRLAVANDLMDRYLPHPMIAGNLLSTWTILKKGLEARGEKDWQGILPQREAIVQEMQRAQEQSKLDKQKAEGDAGFEGKVVKGLTDKGMPPAQAMALVAERMEGKGAKPARQ